METVFIDRVDIKKELYKKIRSRDNALIILLYSETGVGKTALAHQLLRLLELVEVDALLTSIPMNPVNCASTINNNDYAIAVFKKLYKLFSKKNYDIGLISEKLYVNFNFKKYVASAKNPKIKKHLLEFIDEKFIKTSQIKGDIFRDALDVLFQRIFKIGIFDEDNIIEELEKNIIVINDYIEYILKGTRSFIHIDNIQNIDIFSKKYLLDWICSSQEQRNVFIFEYTLSTENSINLAHFIDFLSLSKVELINVGLSRLKEDDVVKIAVSQVPERSKDETFINHVRAHYVGESNGNLFELEKYILTYDLYSKDINNNALCQNLLLLDKNKKFVISLIILHSGRISVRTLKSLLKQSDILLLDNEIDELISDTEYIKIEEDCYALKHASIIDTWRGCDSLKKERAYYVAYDCCVKYYSNILKYKNFFIISRSKCISLLLDLYAEFEPQALVGLINELDEISIGVLSPQETWKKIFIIYKSIMPFADKFENEIYHIVKICLHCELFEKAQYCLENISSSQFQKSKKWILYRCLIYSLRERHLDVLEYVESNIHNFDMETDQYLYLFKISSLRSLNREAELHTLVDMLRQKQIFQHGYTAGCFLRLSEIYESRQDAIGYIKQSIEMFEGMEDEEQASKSRISLSYLLAVTGDMAAAFRENSIAESKLITTIRNRCIFNVNKAALLLLSRKFTVKIWDLLNEAEPLTNSVFNRVAIFINKLIYCIEIEDYEMGELCAEKLINELQNESDRHIIAIGAYDLYLYYIRTDRAEIASKFYHIAYENRRFCNTLWSRLEPARAQDPTSNFLLSRPWHVCFLSYWDVDLKLG